MRTKLSQGLLTLLLVLGLLLPGCAILPQDLADITEALAATSAEKAITITYDFPEPRVEETWEVSPLKGALPVTEGYVSVTMEGLPQWSEPGLPVLPFKTARVLLPYGFDVERITVTGGNKVALPGSYMVKPGQEAVPLSYEGPVNVTPPDPDVYDSSAPFPGKLYSGETIQSKSGYRILLVNLHPIEYIPKQGQPSYYETLTVQITLRAAAEGEWQHVRHLAQDEDMVREMVDNPETIRSYRAAPPSPERPSLLDPGDYEYVIITSAALEATPGPYDFQSLRDEKISRGINATIVTTEWIYANYPGTRPDGGEDNQTRIRNFIIDAYSTWGTRYVLLGGDGDGADVGGESGDSIIPHRGFAAAFDSDIAADMYYACLDGSFDYNANGIYGEPDDGPEGGEVDLFAEVYVGRAPVDSQAEVQNFVRKTLAYQNMPMTDENLRKVWMVGEYLGLGGVAEWGGNYKDEIKEGSSAHGYTTVGFENSPYVAQFDVSTLYDRDYPSNDWPTSEIVGIINDNAHLINHLGHAYVGYVMKMFNSDVDGLTNEELYFIGYSQGCYSGSFDNRTTDPGYYTDYDCISEHLTTQPHGAVAFIANSRYGWGVWESTDAPSQHYDREFWDAVLGEDILNIGIANQDSKEDNAGRVGSWVERWCYYQINLFGDPELTLKLARDSGIEGFVTDAETEEPLEEAKVLVEEAGSAGYTDGSGYYRFFLPAGNYTLTASAFGYYGQNATVEVVEGAFTSQNFALEPMPTGFIAGNVTDVETTEPIAGAIVTLLDTPLSTPTNETGEYSIGAPVGTYDVRAWAWGYQGSIVHGVAVAQDETVIVNFALEPVLAIVAVLGDYKSQLTNLLLANDISAEERGWDIIGDIYHYDVVVVNCPSDPGEYTFLDFLDAASDNGVGVVFTSSWPSQWVPYGISLLQWYLGDPAGQSDDCWSGDVYYQVREPHPIFEGLLDSTTIITGDDCAHAWFWGYSGYTIADIGSEYGGIRGDAVALGVYGESLHVLLAGLAPQWYTNVHHWTEDAGTIFVRGVLAAGGLIAMDLSVVTTELPPAMVGTQYEAALNAMGGTKPYTWAIIDGALPDGLQLDSETGTISGTPTEAGTFSFTVEVTDAAEATATRELSISIIVWTEFITDPGGDQFGGYGPDIVGVDFHLDETTTYFRVRTAEPIDPNDTVNYMCLDLDLDASTGFVSPYPDIPTNDIGADAVALIYPPYFYGVVGEKWPLPVQGTDGERQIGTEPAQASSGGLWGELNLWDPYYQDFYYAGNFPVFTDTDYFWFAIPLDMLNDDGVMAVVDLIGDSWEPTDVAPNEGHGITAGLRIVSTTLHSGTLQISYRATLSAAGGTEPYSWAIIGGALPDGLGLGAGTSIISGIPTTVGTFGFAVEVTDANQNTATASLSLRIFEGCFIATAAYGTDTAKEIDILREFRDTVLLPNSLGARFVSFYYETSPPIADFISQHEVLRTTVRVGFVDPIVRIISWSHDLWSPPG